MATIIAHPQHGKMFVYCQADIDRHALLGWSVWEPKPAEKTPPQPEQDATKPAKRGRPRKT